MWCLATNATVTRDQFKILPMPDLVVAHITLLAESQGYTRGIDPDVGPLEVDNDDRDMQLAAPLPDMMAIDGRNGVVQLADHYVIAPAAGVYDDLQRLGPEPQLDEGNAQLIQVAAPIPAPPMPIERQYLPAQRNGRNVDTLQSLQQHPSRTDTVRLAAGDPIDDASQRYRNDSAFTISVTAALRDRRDEATL